MSEQTTQNLSNDDSSNIQLILGELRAINGRLDNLETRMGNLETRLDSLEARLGNLETRMDALEEKVDRRLQETRPIWEAVLERLTAIEQRVASVEDEMKDFRYVIRFHDLERFQRDFNEQIEKLENRDAA